MEKFFDREKAIGLSLLPIKSYEKTNAGVNQEQKLNLLALLQWTKSILFCFGKNDSQSKSYRITVKSNSLNQ